MLVDYHYQWLLLQIFNRRVSFNFGTWVIVEYVVEAKDLLNWCLKAAADMGYGVGQQGLSDILSL